eukprot:TRINITY_DN16759_c0_g1_i1.p4 TRINITY_DN16759_c0_g1~~TRINITY_DN16759_c0_g1_i1.p4  ORF type:complete len:103 (-),score=31.72 TRINITY_DN16759_c0_g1_i1:89-397(-)
MEEAEIEDRAEKEETKNKIGGGRKMNGGGKRKSSGAQNRAKSGASKGRAVHLVDALMKSCRPVLMCAQALVPRYLLHVWQDAPGDARGVVNNSTIHHSQPEI